MPYACLLYTSGKLLDELNVLAGDGVKVVVTVSADMDVLPESVKKYA